MDDVVRKEKDDAVPNKLTDIGKYSKLLQLSHGRDLVLWTFTIGWMMSLVTAEIMYYRFGLLPSKFYGILPEKNWKALKSVAVELILLLIMVSVVKGVCRGVGGLVNRSMRRNLTLKIHNKYLQWTALRQLDHSILDNPDQRITEDISKFCNGIENLLPTIFIAPALIVYYTWRVSVLMGSLGLAVIYSHWLVSLGVLRVFMGPLKRLTIKNEVLEGDFRYGHVHTRTHLESILITGNGLLERLHSKLNSLLYPILSVIKQIVLLSSAVEGLKSLSAYSGGILNYLIIAYELMYGEMKDVQNSSDIVQKISLTSFVAMYLIHQLGRLVGLVDVVSGLNGQVERLIELLFVLDNSGNREDINQTVSSIDDGICIEFRNVTCIKPSSDTIVFKGLSFSVTKGQGLFITGPNGSGKTSIIRLLLGLWSPKEGSIEIKESKDKSRPFSLSCPQTPVILPGTILDQLILKNQNTADDPNRRFQKFLTIEEDETKNTLWYDRIKGALESVNLDITRIFGSSDNWMHQSFTISEWQQLITPGQLQRLALARILLHRPHIAVLDETTAALDQESEKRFLELLSDADITIILTGHRKPVVSDYFGNCVDLTGL